MKKPLIIAHRGASSLAPENTLAAFRRAIDDGAEGLEFDVRLSKDEVPVVIPDGNLRRVAQIQRRVSDFTAAELKEIDVGSWFNSMNPKFADERFSAERISTLGEILEFLGGFSGLIYIELKLKEDEAVAPLVKAVSREISASPLLPQIIVKSFRLQAISETRCHCPDVKTAALFAPKIRTILRKEKYLLKLAREFKADQISLHYSLASRKLTEKAEKKNLPVTIWTADNALWVKRALNLGIGAIITNNPARLLKKRREIIHKNSILN
jgi:glycerophosphoryl diester phosphodiesterase